MKVKPLISYSGWGDGLNINFTQPGDIWNDYGITLRQNYSWNVGIFLEDGDTWCCGKQFTECQNLVKKAKLENES